MDKGQDNINSTRVITRIFFVSIFIVIVISYLYLLFFAAGKDVQFSPDEGSGLMSGENGLVLIRALGQEGLEWYCGKIESFTDSKGNVYGAKELEELKKILGNEEFLRGELCYNGEHK